MASWLPYSYAYYSYIKAVSLFYKLTKVPTSAKEEKKNKNYPVQLWANNEILLLPRVYRVVQSICTLEAYRLRTR